MQEPAARTKRTALQAAGATTPRLRCGLMAGHTPWREIKHKARGQQRLCSHCGSRDIQQHLRDAHADESGVLPPRESYGAWLVCTTCGHEEPAPRSAFAS